MNVIVVLWLIIMVIASSSHAASEYEFLSDFSKMKCISCENENLSLDFMRLVMKKNKSEFLNENYIFAYYECGDDTQKYFIDNIKQYSSLNAGILEFMGIFIVQADYEKDVVCNKKFSMNKKGLIFHKGVIYKQDLSATVDGLKLNELIFPLGEEFMDNPLFMDQSYFELESVIKNNPHLPLFTHCLDSYPQILQIKGRFKEMFNFYSLDCSTDEDRSEFNISIFHPLKCEPQQWKNISLMNTCHYGDFKISEKLASETEICKFIRFLNPDSSSPYHLYFTKDNSTLLMKTLESCSATVLIGAQFSKPKFDIHELMQKLDQDCRLNNIRESIMLAVVDLDLLTSINGKHRQIDSAEIAVHTQHMGYVTYDGSKVFDFIEEQLVIESLQPRQKQLLTGFGPKLKELDSHFIKLRDTRKSSFGKHFNYLGTLSPKSRDRFDQIIGNQPLLIVIYKQAWSLPSKFIINLANNVNEFISKIHLPTKRFIITVDCFDLNKECNSQNITVFPTVIVYSKDKDPVRIINEFSFNKLAKLILNHIYSNNGTINSEKEFQSRLKATQNLTDLIVMGLNLHLNQKAESEFQSIRESVNGDVIFMSAIKQGLPQSLQNRMTDEKPYVIILSTKSPAKPLKIIDYSDKYLDPKDLIQEIESASQRQFIPLSWSFVMKYKEDDRQLAVLFHSDKLDFSMSDLLRVMAEYPTLIPVSANVFTSPYNSQLLKEYGGSRTPAIAIVNLKKKSSMLYEGTMKDMDALTSWLDESVKGNFPTKSFSTMTFPSRSVGVSMNSAMYPDHMIQYDNLNENSETQKEEEEEDFENVPQNSETFDNLPDRNSDSLNYDEPHEKHIEL